MGQRTKYTYEMKLSAVMKYLEGKASVESIGRGLGTNGSRIVEWATIYQALGAEGLRSAPKLSAYSTETKHNAVCEYLSGKGTLREIQKKYGIRSDKQLRNWIKQYNGHKELRHIGGNGSEIYMTKGRKTTYEERIEIVSYCIENGKDYAQTIEKYGASYQQIYTWVRKYEQDGAKGLADKRGKRKDISEMTKVERLQAENRLLKAEIKQKEVENAILKKVEELERRGY